MTRVTRQITLTFAEVLIVSQLLRKERFALWEMDLLQYVFITGTDGSPIMLILQ